MVCCHATHSTECTYTLSLLPGRVSEILANPMYMYMYYSLHIIITIHYISHVLCTLYILQCQLPLMYMLIFFQAIEAVIFNIFLSRRGCF